MNDEAAVMDRPEALEKKTPKASRWTNTLFGNATSLSALLTFGLLFAIMVALLMDATPALSKYGLSFLSSDIWDPVSETFGGLPSIYGTLVTAAIAMLLGVPTAFGIAIFITELCPPVAREPLRIAIELLAGIPSIIYGMWGLLVFGPFFGEVVSPMVQNTLGQIPGLGRLFEGPPIGIGLLPAGIILAIMVIPFISSVMREVFVLVPGVLRESAFALGATTWEVLWRVILPYSRAGVIGGIILGLGRALGETMAVTFVVGNAHEIPWSILMPGTTISATIANEYAEATGELHTSALIALGLILFLITTVVLAFAQFMLYQLEKGRGRENA